VGARFSAPVQTGPGAHPASCTMGTWSFPEVKSGRGVTLTPHPLLVPWSRKSRAIPLLPLWAVRPAQSLSACTRVHFTFTLYVECFLRHFNLRSIHGVLQSHLKKSYFRKYCPQIFHKSTVRIVFYYTMSYYVWWLRFYLSVLV